MSTPHFVGVFLIDAEDDGFGKAVGLFQEVGEMAGNRTCPGSQGNDALEVLRAVFLVRDGTAVAVQFIFAGSPARRIPFADDPVDAVRSKETILDALAQGVLVDRIAEIQIGVTVVLAQRGGRHAELICWLEPFEDFPPVGIITGAAAMTFVHDHQIEKVAGELLVKRGTVGIARKSLIDREIHLPAFHHLTGLDLVAGIPERGEDAVLRIVHQDVAVGEEQDLRPAVLAGAVPAGVPEFPTDLEGDGRFSRAGRHGEQLADDSQDDAFDGAVDRDLLRSSVRPF